MKPDIAITVCIAIIFASCSSSPVRGGLLAFGKMKEVLFDLAQVDEYINNFVVKDSTAIIRLKRSTMYEQVFRMNTTTRKEFFDSYKYYQEHPDLHRELMDSLAKVK